MAFLPILIGEKCNVTGHLGSSERAALREKFGPWYQMSCLKPIKAHIFHESCWIILSRQLEEDLDLDKFFEGCKDVAGSGRNTLCEQVAFLTSML
jgi:hypothetical protein